ncbi:tRNA pseudouridine(38-40) synthase TruA [Flavobacteriaceae bacterium 3-367]|uniref:tRNA pseudouridine(38-40) synthase TruA n=1 Tax=Eudoraea algarum TaxID=3417568 RepID=UPI00326EA1EE
MRYFIAFSYFGKSYHGWQNQPNALTVQEVMEGALSKLLRQSIALVGAGRTDAGVHAKQMFAHFDFGELPEDLVFRLNAFLPEDIAVQEIYRTPDHAHARFDALERTYEYWVISKKDPFYKEAAHYIKHPLNVGEMNKAAAVLLDYEDFECFSKSNTDVKTYLCKIKNAGWEKRNHKMVFTITADRFLRNMVRAVVGTLLDVGLGKSGLEEMRAIIESKDRSRAGVSVPAKGLYLTQVVYPDNIIEQNG